MIFVFVNSKQTSNRFVLQQRGKYLLAEIPKPPLSSFSVLGKTSQNENSCTTNDPSIFL